MAEFILPKNSKVTQGLDFIQDGCDKKKAIKVRVYRYDPDKKGQPRLDIFYLKQEKSLQMVLDLLLKIKNDLDPSLAFRRSCREGVCGSCTMNINGTNSLACTKSLEETGPELVIYPLPHLPVIKDLVGDLSGFYRQYAKIKPWLHSSPVGSDEQQQSEIDRQKLDGLYDCILCAACSTACPSYWWNTEKFLGPAALLQAYRWIMDTRDNTTQERLDYLDDTFKLYRCHTIMNCTKTCPKGLNPAQAITSIKNLLSSR